MSTYSVYFGTVGWMHAKWKGDFYPEDMPEDWQLSFYNTQFRCVYLPYEFWRSASDETVAAWLKETRDGFRFVLQFPESVDEDARLLAQRFGQRGIPEGQIELLWLEGEINLRNLAQRMQAAQSGDPLFVVSRDDALTQLRQIEELMNVLGV